MQDVLTTEKPLWDGINLISHHGNVSNLIFDMTMNDDHKGLINPSQGLSAVLEEVGAEQAEFDSIIVEYQYLERMMNMLHAAMNNAATDKLQVSNMTISKPFKRNKVAQVAVEYALSDGQTATILFHNPDSTPAKLGAKDTLLSWKILVNSRDVTGAVQPNQGQGIAMPILAGRLMGLLAKNSARYQRTQARKAIQADELAQAEQRIQAKQDDLTSINGEIDTLKTRIDEIKIAQSKKPVVEPEPVQELENSTVDDPDASFINKKVLTQFGLPTSVLEDLKNHKGKYKDIYQNLSFRDGADAPDYKYFISHMKVTDYPMYEVHKIQKEAEVQVATSTDNNALKDFIRKEINEVEYIVENYKTVFEEKLVEAFNSGKEVVSKLRDREGKQLSLAEFILLVVAAKQGFIEERGKDKQYKAFKDISDITLEYLHNVNNSKVDFAKSNNTLIADMVSRLAKGVVNSYYSEINGLINDDKNIKNTEYELIKNSVNELLLNNLVESKLNNAKKVLQITNINPSIFESAIAEIKRSPEMLKQYIGKSHSKTNVVINSEDGKSWKKTNDIENNIFKNPRAMEFIQEELLKFDLSDYLSKLHVRAEKYIQNIQDVLDKIMERRKNAPKTINEALDMAESMGLFKDLEGMSNEDIDFASDVAKIIIEAQKAENVKKPRTKKSIFYS